MLRPPDPPHRQCCLRAPESPVWWHREGNSPVLFYNASIRFLSLIASTAVAVTCAEALELIGQAGVLGEWELTASVTATGGKQEFAGPITLKHTGVCTTDEPE